MNSNSEKITPRWNRLDWLNLLILAVLVGLFFWRIITPNLADRQSFPPGDFSHQFWAFTTFELRELGAGRLPLWNPHTFGGAPFWADVQSAVLYPPSLLTLLLSAPWGFSLYALELEAIAHIWLAGVGMYLLMRRLTGHRPATFLAALSWTFSGYLTGYPSQQLAVLQADVWLPFILYGLTYCYDLDLKNVPNRSGLALPIIGAGGAWTMALLAGHPQSGFIVATVSLSYALFRLLQFKAAHPDLTGFGNLLGLLPLAYLPLGLLLAAIQFLPAVEYTLNSVRSAGTYDKMSGGFPMLDLIQIPLPNIISHYSPLYVGVVGILLVSVAITQRQTRYWTGLAGVSLLISFGGNTFLYSPLYLFVPGFSIFRGQERWAFATAFALCVLIGYGAHAVLTQREALIRLLANSRLVLIGASLMAGLSFYGLNDTGWRADNPFYDLLSGAIMVMLVSGVLWLAGRWGMRPQSSTGHTEPAERTQGGRTKAVLIGVLAVLISFDLFTVNWQTNLYPQLPEWHTAMPPAVAAIKADAGNYQLGDFRVYNEFRVYDNYGIPFELEDLWGASPLRPSRFDRFIQPPLPIERLWTLFNVKYVLTWRQELFLPSEIIHQEPAEDGTTYVHRLNETSPRVWFASQAEFADPETIRTRLTEPNFEPLMTVLLEPPALSHTSTTDSSARITRLSHTPNQLRYELTTAQAGWLVFSEPLYPGWHATVNGQSTPILPAYDILRALPVDVGTHTVQLDFWPLSFVVGAWVSGLTALLTTVIAGLAVTKLRSTSSGDTN